MESTTRKRGPVMLIALLALLGVDLIVLVALVASWERVNDGWCGSRRLRGAIRVIRRELHGLAPKWKRGYGHWVRDVLVWTKAPFLFRNELVATGELVEQRHAPPRRSSGWATPWSSC